MKNKYQIELENKVIKENDVFVAETAIVLGNVLLKNTSSIWFGAVLGGGRRHHLGQVGQRRGARDKNGVGVPVLAVGQRALLEAGQQPGQDNG